MVAQIARSAVMIGVVASVTGVIAHGGRARRDRHWHGADQCDRKNEVKQRAKPTHGGENRDDARRAQ
jgi:hypothetical protein